MKRQHNHTLDTHKQIAPRLASGDCRITVTLNLPPDVREGLLAIAAHEGQSVSWVLEQAVYDYFGLQAPTFRTKRKAKNVVAFTRAATQRKRGAQS